jgi:serine/threonine protein kinase
MGALFPPFLFFCLFPLALPPSSATFSIIPASHPHFRLYLLKTENRDIKPGNFMLLDSGDNSPLKAIDFGLAVPFKDEDLPLDNLGFDGTPWFMAPEVRRKMQTSETYLKKEAGLSLVPLSFLSLILCL